MTIEKAAARLRAGQITSVELTAEAIAKIHDSQPALNAFITVTEQLALSQAQQADDDFALGIDRSPLQGIPYALKDMFCTKGIRTTCGSKLFENYIPDTDAAVYERLRAAGAVLLGKTGLHELAYGITSQNPHFGPVSNPRDTSRVPGGSSGGSGAAVAAGLVYFAMGSDTGGSIRLPAAFCGCVGLKPTSGRISRFGTLPLDYSLDHMGPLTRTVRDAALVLNALAGEDRRDDTCSHHPVDAYLPDRASSLAGRRLGLPANFFNSRLEPKVRNAFDATIDRIRSLGAEIVPITLPDPSAVTTIGRMILLSEASALLGQYAHRREDFGADVIALIDQGRLISATDYINAQRLRRVYQQQWAAIWNHIDALLVPASPNEAPLLGEPFIEIDGEQEEVRIASTRFVRCFNVLGNPALVIPFPGEGAGVMTGLQVVGAPFAEKTVLDVTSLIRAE